MVQHYQRFIVLSTVAVSLRLLVVTAEAVYGGSSRHLRRPMERVYSPGRSVFSFSDHSPGAYHAGDKLIAKDYAPPVKTYSGNVRKTIAKEYVPPEKTYSGKVHKTIVKEYVPPEKSYSGKVHKTIAKEYVPPEKTYSGKVHKTIVKEYVPPEKTYSGNVGKAVLPSIGPLVGPHNIDHVRDESYVKPKVGGPLLPKVPFDQPFIGEPGHRPPSLEDVYGKRVKKVKKGINKKPETVDGVRVGDLVAVGTITADGEIVENFVPERPLDPPHQRNDHFRPDSNDPEVHRQNFGDFVLRGRSENRPQHEPGWRQTHTPDNSLRHVQVQDRRTSPIGLNENTWPRRAQDQRVQFDSPVWSGHEQIPKSTSGSGSQVKRKLSKNDRLRLYHG